VDVWVDGVGARKEKERERDGETEREMGRECGRGTRRWASRLSPPFPSLSLSLSLSQRTEDRHRRLPSFSLSFFFYLLPAGKGYVSGGEMLAGCGKDGKQEKGKERGRERE
jgi:hypothetical protein